MSDLCGSPLKCIGLISIIIPILNEAAHLPATLQAMAKLEGVFEIIVVDGGSTDGTLALLEKYPTIQVIRSAKAERAAQMNAGALAAGGDILWFVHADTLVPANSLTMILRSYQHSKVVGGSFRLQFDRCEWPYRLLGWFTRFNSRWWTFGDQGIFVRRRVFEQLGGYADMPMLEDLELQLRLREVGRLVKLRAAVITSARRYHRWGLRRTFWRDVMVVVGYFFGVNMASLAAVYRKWYAG